MKRIVENDLGLPGAHVESYSYSQVERRFFLSIITNFLLAVTLFALSVVFSFLDGPLALVIVGFSVMVVTAVFTVIYYPLGRHLLEICRTKENFLAAPPLIDKSFDVILQKTLRHPISIDRPKKTTVLGISFLFWSGIVGVYIYYLSLYSWDRYPILLGICATLLVATVVISSTLARGMKGSKAWFLLALSQLLAVFLLFAMEYIELGSVHFLAIFSQLGFPGIYSPIQSTNTLIAFVTILLISTHLYRGFRTSREERDDAKSGRDALLREAISRFDPVTMTADEPEVAAKPFPRRWIWIIGLYAAAIVAMGCLGVLLR